MAEKVTEMLFAGIGSVGLLILKNAVEELKQMKLSMIELNKMLAVLLERVDSHEKRITKLEET